VKFLGRNFANHGQPMKKYFPKVVGEAKVCALPVLNTLIVFSNKSVTRGTYVDSKTSFEDQPAFASLFHEATMAYKNDLSRILCIYLNLSKLQIKAFESLSQLRYKGFLV
jgi:hypothetical protein